MACLSIDQNVSFEICGGNVGGVSRLLLANRAALGTVGASGGVVTGVSGASGAFYTYSLGRSKIQVTEVQEGTVETGSVLQNQSITFFVDKDEVAKRNQLALLTQAEVVALVLDSNGEWKMYGLGAGTDNGDGLYVSAMSLDTGLAKTDVNRTTVTLTGQLKEKALFVNPALIPGYTAP